ncbi:hypothetical protein BSQ39_07090 [Loigolactobacillus backii]|nr:hypothetical protein BSQ39_07090 [Loigolactobacillus backii]
MNSTGLWRIVCWSFTVYLGARCIYIVVNQTSFPLDLVAILILTLAISGYMGFQIIYHRLDEVDVQNRDQLDVGYYLKVAVRPAILRSAYLVWMSFLGVKLMVI